MKKTAISLSLLVTLSHAPVHAHGLPAQRDTVPLFEARLELPATFGPTGIAAADLDGNGHTDIAVSLAGVRQPRNELILHFFDAGGLARTAILATKYEPEAVVAADLDDDGDIDLATVEVQRSLQSRWKAAVTLFPNNGNGRFSGKQSVDLPSINALGEYGYLSLAAGRFGGTGEDLVIAHRDGIVLLKTTVGAFGVLVSTLTEYDAVQDPRSLNAIDVDADGYDDVVMGADGFPFTRSILGVVFYGDGAGGLVGDPLQWLLFPIEAWGPWMRVRATDLDGDDDVDFLSAPGHGPWPGTPEPLARYHANVQGAFPASLVNRFLGVRDGRDALLGDFDGDALPDLVLSSGVLGHVEVFLNTGASAEDPDLFRRIGAVPTGHGASWLASGDWNGDGWLDLACVDHDDGRVSVLYNRGRRPMDDPGPVPSDSFESEGLRAHSSR